MDNQLNFEQLKQKFINASVDEKIDIYTSATGLTVEQFKELLRHFPVQHFDKLEKAVG